MSQGKLNFAAPHDCCQGVPNKERSERPCRNQSTAASGLRTNKRPANPRVVTVVFLLPCRPNQTYNCRRMASLRRRKTPAACPTRLGVSLVPREKHMDEADRDVRHDDGLYAIKRKKLVVDRSREGQQGSTGPYLPRPNTSCSYIAPQNYEVQRHHSRREIFICFPC